MSNVNYFIRSFSQVMEYDSNTNVHWAMTDVVSSRDDIERKFGKYTYSKVNNL